MIRTTSVLAILAVAATTPALASTANDDGAKAFTAELTRQANEQQAREFLARRGYIATSELRRGSDGECDRVHSRTVRPSPSSTRCPPAS